MSFPRKVYIVVENGPEWSVRLGVFKHRPDAVKLQQKVIASNESVVVSNLKMCTIDVEEEIVQ